MLSKTESRAIYGIYAYRVDVEVDICPGIPSFTIVGLPDAACRESSKRVLAAIKNSGYQLSSLKITVNLAPAHMRKEGSMYDLPIALAVLAALKKIDPVLIENKVICGELSLDGALRPIKGALSIADDLKNTPDKELLLPDKNFLEASVINSIRIVPVRTLNEAITYLIEGSIQCAPTKAHAAADKRSSDSICFSDVKGNANAKRAMEVAVAGGHNIILIGPPGAGKTMLAKRLPTIMGALSEVEAIETTKIYSICGLLNNIDLIRRPPFRALHHSISDAGMAGGGSTNSIRPGEISLAHNGVLFLDELPEFRRNVLEALRQPIEEGTIRISRCGISTSYPAKFMLCAAMNPCPCGFLTHPEKACTCTPLQISRYLSKISGPLLDRIDMHIEIQPIKYDNIKSARQGETSADIIQRIDRARKVQAKRYESVAVKLNAQLSHREIEKVCLATEEAERLLESAMQEMFISARGYDKILKVARTIADLDGKDMIGTEEMAEAIGYRSLDTQLWLR